MTAVEYEKRHTLALDAIKRAFGTDAGEDSINLFVVHHLEELPMSHWEKCLGTLTPGPMSVLGLLQLRSSWGKNNIEYVL